MEDSKKSTDAVNENKVIDLKVNRDENKTIHSKFGNYQPNEELLQATSRIKKQRDVIMDRIEKMRAASSRVARSVFEKVFRDYNLQLQTISELLNEKKDSLKKEIKDLYLRREKITVEINRHKEILEEAEFRHYLGEFSQTQYKEVENFETKEIEKLESDLSHISQFIRSHENLFDPEDLSLPQDSHPQDKDVTKTVRKEIPQKEPANEELLPTKTEDKAEEIQITDFEDLFLDDEEDTQSKIEESQASIQKIIEEGSIHVGDTADNIVLNNADSNYFKKDKVVESSFNKTKTKNIPSELEVTPAPTKKDDVIPKKSFETTKNTPTLPNDSISEILEALDFDGKKKSEENKNEPLSLENKAAATGDFMLKLVDCEHENKTFILKDNTSIGRSPSNDITLKAPKVSRQHAAINVYNSQYIIIDLKSSNGVYVNGTKIDECILKPGDEISIGGYKFLFVRTQK